METKNAFSKIWGRVDGTLKKGKYKLRIYDQWDTSQFKGKKSFQLQTINVLAAQQNVLLGVAFLLAAIAVILIIVALVVLEFTIGARKKFYSLENLQW